MNLKTEELKKDQLIVVDEGMGFKYLALVIKEAFQKEDLPYKSVLLREINSGKEFTAGGIPGYCPGFYEVDEYLSYYPPEYQDIIKEKLGLK